ncbi:nuclear transport factor 2 family protein [Kitasatospora sp. NPDC089509]|uniref:nuclear transport factor 2 family protein n=1 Tax=Kitasatospora sp. NPDC089509 TaxID=3364079 RepID=UPI00381C4785
MDGRGPLRRPRPPRLPGPDHHPPGARPAARAGPAAVKAAALALGDANPVAHHVTDVVIGVPEDGQVPVRSKGLGIRADGTCGSVSYHDIVVRTGDGWRIRHRKVSARRLPLNGVSHGGAGSGLSGTA